MAEFIRKNKLVISGTFTPKPGQSGTPSEAHVHITYTNMSGAETTETLDMTHNVDGTWSALWDSTSCKGGTVEWVAYCLGGLIGATQGRFSIQANAANNV